MNVAVTPHLWLDIVGVAAIVVTFYIPMKDLFFKLSKKAREKKATQDERDKNLDSMLLDWNGEPARPGVADRPGVMARLGTIEDHLTAIDHEMTFNSGSSIKDAVHRTDIAVETLAGRFAEHISFSEKFQIEVVKKLGGGDATG